MTETAKITHFNSFLKQMSTPELLAVPKDLQPIPGTNNFFYFGALHLVHGLAKTGKTHFVLETLNYAKNVDVIWIDGDFNDAVMINKFQNITHLTPLESDSYLDMWINADVDYTDKIFIIDSLKDFKNKQDMDTNSGMDAIIKRFKYLTKKAATVIVIHHSTVRYGVSSSANKIKIKGNEEAIYSNCDITYLFTRDFNSNLSELLCERSRVNYIKSGATFKKNDPDKKWQNKDKSILKRTDNATNTVIK
jgi:hypothetical protein